MDTNRDKLHPQNLLPPLSPEAKGHWLVDCLLVSYAGLLLSQRKWQGGLMLAVTLVCWPEVGFCGLAALAATVFTAWAVGFNQEQLRQGFAPTNSLLSGLLVSAIWQSAFDGWEILLLAVVVATMTLFLGVILSAELYRRYWLPALGLPVALAHFLCCFVLPAPDPLANLNWPEEFFGSPDEAQVNVLFFTWEGLSSQARWGLLVIGGSLLVHSPLRVLSASFGAVGSQAMLAVLYHDLSPLDTLWTVANGVVAAMMVATLFVPSWGSLLLATISAVIATVTCVGLVRVFEPLDFWPVLLAANVVVLGGIYVMRLRLPPWFVHFGKPTIDTPEENFRLFRALQNHFSGVGLPSLYCPFAETREVTQGFDGQWTHQGNWRYGLDFEVVDEEGRKFRGDESRLDDYLTFNAPVLAPGSGTVVKVVDHVADRPIGANNVGENWGNLVILLLDGGPYVTLCHLRQGSIHVMEGQRVQLGEFLGTCGNSGRSSVPHLHVQLQMSPQVGAPNLPFHLRHYIEHEPAGAHRYHASGVPAEGSRVEPARFNGWLARCFDDVARREYRFVSDDSKSERISCDLDSWGCYRFCSDTGSTLVGYVADSAFHVLEFRRQGETILEALWLGLNRVPFLENQPVHWIDEVHLRPLLDPFTGTLADVLGPFLWYPTLRLESGWKPAVAPESGLRSAAIVETVLGKQARRPRSVPDRIRVSLSESDWVTRIELEAQGKTTIWQQLDREPAQADSD